MKIIINTIIFLVVSITLSGQNYLHLVHGFGGNTGSLKRVNESLISNGANFTMFNHEYEGDNGALWGANKLSQSFTYDRPGNKRVIIAHSLGGLVSSVAANNGDLNQVTGIITAGSSVKGAPIANSFKNGTIADYMSEIFDEVIVDAVYFLTPLSVYRVPSYLENQLGMDLSERLGNFLFGLAEGSLEAFTAPPTVRDLAVGSNITNSIKNISIPRLCFYGEENHPIHWRVLSNLVITKPPSLPVGQIKDNQLPDIMDDVERFLEIGHTVSIVRLTAGILTLNPFLVSHSINAMNYTQEAIDVLDASEGGWGKLTGAYRYVRRSTTQERIKKSCLLQGDAEDWVPGPGDINNDCVETVTTYYYTAVPTSSDGIVPRDRAIADDAFDSDPIRGVNHQELMNHPEAHSRYKSAILDGFYGNPFTVPNN